jgi:membrane protein DedA with SNARE-associated domain
LHDLIQRLLAAYQHSLQTGGYPYLIFLMALESSVVPIPSEVIIPPAVLMAMAGTSSMTLTGIVLAAFGSWIGASAMYWGSRAAGRPLILRYGKLIRVTPSKLEQYERWSERFGSFGVFLSRMLPGVRHLIGVPAGIVRMNFLKYSAYTVLGSLLWCFVLAWVSRVAGQDDRLMHGEIREVTLWATGAAAFLGATYYFFVYRLSRKPA